MLTIVLIVLTIVLIVGTLPTWPYSKTWDYYPSRLLGMMLVLLLILLECI
jgi:hypothetical protein